jgi:MFS family permease
MEVPVSDRARVAGYAATIFLSSAFLLVLEIAAGRLIAPYVGVSLYTWTSIIGVILAGLSLGNWAGGVWADRGAGPRAAGATLIVGALACLAILWLLTLVAPVLQASGLSLLSASFLLVLSLFFLPAMLLGVVTPLLTTLALRLDTRTGHIVGLMHALAALGSILGTFVTGYWLVQYLGTRNIILATAAGLFLLALPLLRGARLPAAAAALLGAVLLGAATLSRDGFADPCDRESPYFCLRVVDSSAEAPFGKARSLILDHLVHGTNHRQWPGLLLAPYVQLMDELVLEHYRGEPPAGLRFFFAGGGAYTQPRAVDALYRAPEVTVAELDPVVTEVAEDALFVDPSAMEVHHADARVVLARLPENRRFDVIVTDVFHDISIPYHLVTREFARQVRGHLAPGGLYTLNIVDRFPDPLLVKSLVKTLGDAFPRVDVWLDRVPEAPTRMTYVVVAGERDDWPDTLRARRGLPRSWLRVTAPLLATGTPLAALPLLTDDYVPVDRLVQSLYFTGLGL